MRGEAILPSMIKYRISISIVVLVLRPGRKKSMFPPNQCHLEVVSRQNLYHVDLPIALGSVRCRSVVIGRHYLCHAGERKQH